MKMGILGKKVGTTQIFDENGMLIPVTVIDTSGCVITQVKTKDSDGYTALQVGIGERKPQNVNKPKAGHFKKAGTAAKAYLTEIRLADTDSIAHLKAGQTLTANMFAKGDKVDVLGTMKGRGFAGVMKRWGFHGTDASHGGHKYYRHGGSNGSNTFPGKVLKNKGMPGQMGNCPRTVQNLKVVEVNEKENLLFVKGSVPGMTDKFVLIRSAKKFKDPGERAWVNA